jgi:type IV pilus assembly protein PilC
MALFHFKAIKTDGTSYEGDLDVLDRPALFKEIKSRGDTVILIEEKEHEEGNSLVKKANAWFAGLLGRVSTQDKIMFARNLGAMISAGLSLSRALVVLEKQIHNKKFKEIIVSLNQEISQGKSLSQAMMSYPEVFSNLFVSMTKAGEESGGLSESLRIVALQMDNNNRLQKKIKGAMIYPAIILCLIAVVAVLMFIFVVPSITGTFREMKVELPMSTKMIIFISDMLKNNSLWVLLIVLVLSTALYYFWKTPRGQRWFEFTILRLPVIGELVKETNSARTARTLSSLITSGVPIAEAIKITGEVVQNSHYRDVIAEAYDNVGKGVTVSSIFTKHENLYPVFVGEMMSVGEETGKMPEMLMGVAAYYESEVEQKTKDMSTIIEPILMIFIGVAVGFFAVSMILPIYSLMDTV